MIATDCIYVALLRPSFFSFLALSLQGEILEEASGGRGRGGEFGCLLPEPTQEGCRLRSLNLCTDIEKEDDGGPFSVDIWSLEALGPVRSFCHPLLP